MDWLAVNLFILFISLLMLVGLPIYFKRKNERTALNEAFQEYWQNMVALDKHYAPFIEQLNKHLNTINYWLKKGIDPTESEEDQERLEQEDRFFAGLMNPLEAKKWRESVRKAKEDNTEAEDVKSIRIPEFFVDDMEEMEVEQSEMEFIYAPDLDDCIYYCATPEALENKDFRHIIYFTTSRPTNIPVVYPYKYEGAQMLSLYKHPAQTVWFLKNWKSIREGLEGGVPEDIAMLDDSIADFDL